MQTCYQGLKSVFVPPCHCGKVPIITGYSILLSVTCKTYFNALELQELSQWYQIEEILKIPCNLNPRLFLF